MISKKISSPSEIISSTKASAFSRRALLKSGTAIAIAPALISCGGGSWPDIPGVPKDFVPEPWSDFLGAQVKSIETELESYVAGMSSIAGVLVGNVRTESIAAQGTQGGILPADVVVAAVINGLSKPLVDSNDLNIALAEAKPLGVLYLIVRRNGKSVPVAIGLNAVTIYNDDWSGIQYSGFSVSSNRRASAFDYMGDVHYATADGSTANISFNGTGVRVLGPVSFDLPAPVFSASLDGAEAKNITVNKVAAYKGQRTLYSVSGLTDGNHTLKLTKLAGMYFQIDRVDVLGLAKAAY